MKETHIPDFSTADPAGIPENAPIDLSEGTRAATTTIKRGMQSAQSVDLQKLLAWCATITTGYTPNPVAEMQESTYYDYPVLKAPVWTWEIVWYFFMGGLAAGSYVIATIANLFGSPEDATVARVGYYTSLLAVLTCPPLLIKDLGRPEKFLNMLRMFKFKSPMSMGVWGLLGFSMFSGGTAIIQGARDGLLGRWWGARLLARLPQKLIALPGSLFAVFLGGYTGVLLAATSIPVWSRSKLLGAVFISSAFSTSTALISCILRLIGAPSKSLHKLERIEWANMCLEMLGLFGYLRASGRAAKALVGTEQGEQGRAFWSFIGGGLLLPWLLQGLLLMVGRQKPHGQQRHKRGGLGLLISALVLIGGYFLRKTIVDAGHASRNDARTTLWNARR
ncbi:polysulfide reductase NrfD [Ktedonobacteria bacterium brp13]|nr:polysulfide reductase NrfD [Ktedonobacteria bacterium brp13]